MTMKLAGLGDWGSRVAARLMLHYGVKSGSISIQEVLGKDGSLLICVEKQTIKHVRYVHTQTTEMFSSFDGATAIS